MTIKIFEQNEVFGKCTNEWAIFKMFYDFYGLDYSQNFVILINKDGKFIIGEKYKNCISIGSGFVAEYPTLEEAKQVVDCFEEKVKEVSI